MASAVLVGVNPIHGLYACVARADRRRADLEHAADGDHDDSASALAAGSAIAGVDADERLDALFLVTALAGAAMVLAGILKFGRYTRFVSLSVMIGFLTGVAANIIFGQLPDLAGVTVDGGVAITKAFHVVTHPGEIDGASLATGLLALAIVLLLARTRLASIGAVIALAVPTLLTLGNEGIARVNDIGEIPSGVPLPHLPELSLLDVNVIVGALSVAAIVLVQGAGVAEAAPNTTGASDSNRDFLAQGVANIASGLFRGQPVGGSVGATALNVSSGARSRWAAIFVGLWMIVVLVFLSGVVGEVAMPTLAAMLMVAAWSSIRMSSIRTVLRTGPTSQIGMITTFLATLALPVAAAVGVGVALSLLLQLNREAIDLRVVELTRDDAGRFVESPAPASVHPRSVTLLDIYGSLFYAGAKTLAARLPDPTGGADSVVVIRLRGRTALGATSFVILADYARRLEAAGGRLYLSGVDPDLLEQFRRTRRVDVDRRVRVYEATMVIGESSGQAVRDAIAWSESRD